MSRQNLHKDLTGKVFGMLTVTKYAGDSKWECKCECGGTRVVSTYNLNKCNITHCGCKNNRQYVDDYTGRQFGEWTVLKKIDNQRYLCRCSCSKEGIKYIGHLKQGASKSCGHNSTAFKDLTGQQFNDWLVLNYIGNQMWNCRCSCGKTKAISGYDLRKGKSKSCGHDKNEFNNLEGRQIGQWKVLHYLERGYWMCKCSCGKVKAVSGATLKNSTSKSCGHKDPLDLKGKKFWDWEVLEYVGYHKWKCRCSCGTERNIPSLRIRSGLTKSCGCKQGENYKNTIKHKYGRYNFSQLHLTDDQFLMTSSAELLSSAIAYNFEKKPTPIQLSALLGITPSQVMRNIRKFNLEELVDLNSNTSKYEDEIASIFPCSIRNDRSILSGSEIDLYYPEQKIGIEFNGDYWHCDKKRSNTYHQDKSIKALKNNISLIHIFEHEWNDENTKQKIINLINKRLSDNINKINIADCEIKEISLVETLEFLDKYSLQNYKITTNSIGCIYNNKLLGLITFSIRDKQYELNEIAWRTDVDVINGTALIFDKFIKDYNPTIITSYCDIAKSDINIYNQLGFKLVEVTKPNYRWVGYNNDVIYNYENKTTDESTEDVDMKDSGYLKVYDCGKFVFTWEKSDTTEVK